MVIKRSNEYFVCPHCGQRVPVAAKSCRHCGSDDETGWSDDARDGSSDIGLDEDFDYNAFVEREFGEHSGHWPSDAWKKIGLALLTAALIYTMLREMGLL